MTLCLDTSTINGDGLSVPKGLVLTAMDEPIKGPKFPLVANADPKRLTYTTYSPDITTPNGADLYPLITPDADKVSAVRFDALMYGIELAYLMVKKYAKARTDLFKKASGIASVANIPEIMVQSERINKILHTDYLENAVIAKLKTN